jgi:hypothetical protein
MSEFPSWAECESDLELVVEAQAYGASDGQIATKRRAEIFVNVKRGLGMPGMYDTLHPF